MDQYAGTSNRSVLKVLVGNKCDKEREIPVHIADQFAHNNNFNIFMETSALQAENVEKLFYEIADVLVAKSQSLAVNGPIQSSTNVDISSENSSRGCMSCLYN
ncbi:Ras-related protein Rab-30-like protein [Leptotrombidium deliense]|uniref:Ras-related protein Rab-30-like protein n=1 Tax=Leptotrombidium deliense TaxID=299467 RepID=A0A443SFK0_9ACAR|nr:Ras-related protein Rab-30-like protein [Leptotrombidium deliense]